MPVPTDKEVLAHLTAQLLFYAQIPSSLAGISAGVAALTYANAYLSAYGQGWFNDSPDKELLGSCLDRASMSIGASLKLMRLADDAVSRGAMSAASTLLNTCYGLFLNAVSPMDDGSLKLLEAQLAEAEYIMENLKQHVSIVPTDVADGIPFLGTEIAEA